jgi:hypothetical protein
MPDFASVELQTLFAGTEVPALTTSVTLASGQGVLKVGAVIGEVSADGKFKLVDKTASDGSQTAKYVLAETVDTSFADVVAVAYKTGIFNYDALYVADGDTVANHKDELRSVGIHFRTDY